MNIDLTGQTAVTGASRGIGLTVTRALPAGGAHVIAGALRSWAEPDKLTAEGTVTALEVDLAAPGGPAELGPATDGGGNPGLLSAPACLVIGYLPHFHG
jgi:NAD(P)-dependent dehydrogenase (short-subunit alcohol dehydrogenase family)